MGPKTGVAGPLPRARKRCPAIDEHRRQVEARHGHHHAGQRLVAAGERDKRVVGMAADDRLDAIGDDLARHKRIAHAAVVHGHGIGDGDRREVERDAARLADRGARCLRELAEQCVTRRYASIGGSYADERFGKIGVLQPERMQERAVRCPVESFDRDARGEDWNAFFGAQERVFSRLPVVPGSKNRRRSMFRAVVAFALSVACMTAMAQQPYPSHPVKIVVPYGVGGSADVYARLLGAKLQETLGQPVIIENKPGGGSIVGTDAVAKADPDGYTLLMMSNTHTVNETLIPKKPFELMRDLAPISGVSYADLMMVIHPSVPANNLKEFIAYAKANPGKLNYASSGNGTPYHMAGELFKSMAGVDLVHIPHKGSDQARASILGGQVQMMFDAVPTMAANAKAGKVKALATSGSKRSPVTPEIPTVAEAGLPGYESGIWLGLMAPAKTPRPVLEKLNADVNKILASPDVKENWLKQGTLTMGMSIEQFDKFLREEIVKWAKVVKMSGAKAD